MKGGNEPQQGHAAIDAASQLWRQGDCVLGDEWFMYRGDPSTGSHVPDAEEVVEQGVDGLSVLTQTCDIVRNSRMRPFVEVCPLVATPHIEQIKAGRRPNYAYIPGVAHLGLVADLDRVMTISKNVMAGWQRVPGCGTDIEVRDLAAALKRKRARFAFSNDFVVLCGPLQDRLAAKHGKGSPEGAALTRLREVRVQASPSWDAQKVDLMFWFIRARDDASGDWPEYLKKWLDLLSPSGRFGQVHGVVLTLDDLTAAEYLNSEALDLDHLSQGR